MAMVRTVTITTVVNPAGAISEHTISAHLEVGGEQRVEDFSQDAELRTMAEEMVSRIHRDALVAECSRAQSVIDAETAFD
ncbi:MAG: hypothetical protein NVS2B16_08340 [Chloroflexota bacterium]